ncbi:retrovirus-related pol polyprotein from transposon TNT 1-94 [Tanacetum coccineum]
MDEIETINIELEHSVAKLLSENKLLHKEIEHLKKIYKDQFDSIKKTRAFSKEHNDSLITQLNSKSMENTDLKGVICSTSSSGSKPTWNTKNNRISQSSSSNKTKKVEDQSKSVKSRKNKKNRIAKTECNAYVMQSMLNANSKPVCAIAVATACYTQNQSLIRKRHNKTPYELLHNKKPDLSCLHVFGALCYPTNDSEDLGKLQPKADIGIFVGYAPTKKAFWIYNRRTCLIIETIHVTFDEQTAMASEQFSLGPGTQLMTPATLSSRLMPNLPSPTPSIPPTKKDWEILFQPMFDEYFSTPISVAFPVPVAVAPVPADSTGTPSSTSVDQDAPSPSTLQTSHETQAPVLSSSVEEKNHDIEVAYIDNDQYFSIPIPEPSYKESSSQVVVPNNVHSVNQPPKHISKWTKDHPIDNSYKEALTETWWIEAMQEELNEFERPEVWEIVPRPDHVMIITLKWIYKVKLDELGGVLKSKARLIVYQLDMKTTFLNGILREKKFSKGVVDPTLFIRREGKDILLVQINVDDIIFASTKPELCETFSEIMCLKFKMSMMGKLSFFLGLQISQSPRGIFLNQSKYALEIIKKYGMETSEPVDTPMVEKSKLDEDPQGKAVDPTRYRGMIGSLMYLTSNTRRSTSRSMQLLGDRLVSWSSKKQKITTISSIEAEYIALSGCCDQIIWMRSQLTAYGLGFNKIPLYYDNKSAISLCCNNVQHSRSKHIDIRYHFIKEQVENRVVELYFVRTEYQLADIFTKALGRERLDFLINKLGMRSVSPKTLKSLAKEEDE